MNLKVSWEEYRAASCRPERLAKVDAPLFDEVMS